MTIKHKTFILSIFISAAFIFSLTTNTLAGEYDSLTGIESINAVFDFRVANPNSAAVHLDLIYTTFKDQNLTIKSKKPDFAVIFMGPAVKLVSKNRTGFTAEDQKYLDAIADTVSDMAKDGIKLEVCLAAVHLTGGDPALILPQIKQVGSGWISSIGYQQKGYALIPAF